MLQRVAANLYSTSDVYRFAKSNGVDRLVFTEKTSTHQEILLCGVLKITYEFESQKIEFLQAKHSDFENKTWVEMSPRLKNKISTWIGVYFIPGQSSDKYFFKWLLDEAVTILINDLLEIGSKIEGEAEVYICSYCECNDTPCECIEKNLGLCYLKSEQLMEGNVTSDYVNNLLRVNLKFAVAINGKMVFENKKLISEKPFKSELLVKFLYLTFHNNSAWNNAGKLLYKASSVFFDRVVCKKMMKVYSGRYFAHFSLADYLKFKKKYVIDVVDDNLLSLLRDDDKKVGKTLRRKVFYDGSNESMLSFLKSKDCDVSRSEIKLFRQLPVTLVGVCGRAVKLEKNNSNRLCFFKLLRHKQLLKRFPVNYINQIGELFLQLNLEEVDVDSVGYIFSLWFEARKDTLKKYPFKKNRDVWDNELGVLRHALDWLIFNKPQINKNQRWSSILKLVQKWDDERFSKQADKIPNFSWPPLSDNYEYEIEGVYYREILSTRDLFIEGKTLKHCVYDYRRHCLEQEYRVFSVLSGSERATLGIDCRINKLTFNQVYAEYNRVPSVELQQKVRAFVEVLNKKGSK